MGLTHSDHFQPGSNVPRIAVASPKLTTSTLAFGTSRTSSGASKRLIAASAIVSLLFSFVTGLRAGFYSHRQAMSTDSAKPLGERFWRRGSFRYSRKSGKKKNV